MSYNRSVALSLTRDLRKVYRNGRLEQEVVRGLDVEVRAGELTLLMGPSGSGKTTLLSMLAGLLRPSSGEIELLGEPIHSASERELTRLRRHGVGFVFQQPNLFPALTALENVAEVLALKGMSRPNARTAAEEALVNVGLGDRLKHKPAELSGGQKQRVAVARALAPNPKMLFGDEITAALDGTSAFGVMELIRAFVRPHTAALLVTHDSRLERFADRVLTMEDGILVSDRTPDGTRTMGGAA
jgi:putative ABC transport system ATP-binding protein